MTGERAKPTIALPILLGILGLVIGPFITAELGWNFGVVGGLETLGQDLLKGAILFAAGGICLGVVLNFIMRVVGNRKGG